MRFFAGLLLVVAAILKAIQFLVEPTVPLTIPFGHWPPPAQIGIELAAGMLLLTGLYWQQLRWFAVALFAGFASYSLKLALSGATSCGCFGPIRIHPWWTLTLDITVLLGLLISFRQNADHIASDHLAKTPRFLHGRLIFAAILGLSALSVILLFRFADNRTAAANGLLHTAGSVTVLEPEKWIGQKLPIADFIDLDLSKGPWIVLLHRHDCPDCQAAVPRYEELAARNANARVALVEVPPYGDTQLSTGAVSCGRLNNGREWFVQTPVELQLLDGVVTSASTELPALTAASGR